MDPWKTYDNFRINHRPLREFKLQEGEDTIHKVKIEYLSENKFNVHIDADELGVKTNIILSNAEVFENQEKEGELIIRTEHAQFKVPYLRDDQNKVYCLDSEGAPLKLVKLFS